MAGDPYAKRWVGVVFTGSKGGLNRIRLISIIKKTPLNANQLAKELGLDYKAIQHHVNVLTKNNLITRVGEKYGAVFFISTFLEVNLETFDESVTKLEQSKYAKKG